MSQFPTIDQMMDEAATATGLSDFGGDHWRKGLEAYLDSSAREATLTEPARDAMHAIFVGRLKQRLLIADCLRRHPEIDAQPDGQTVSITGLPRTGTTALCNILSLDDAFRSLRKWEQINPCPPPVLGEEEHDPRRLALVAEYEEMARTQPEMMAMHLWDADATEEDVFLLNLDFHGQNATFPVLSYHKWWREADLTETFAFHRRVTRLLQWKRPPNDWFFKAPAHNFHMEALRSAYPGTKFICTHRDPSKSIPSAISFINALLPPGSGLFEDKHFFGRHNAEHLRVGVERAMAARKRIGEENFMDVHHRDFIRDPFGTLEKIYAFLGRDFRPEARAKMEAWHAQNRSGAHGAHHYTAEEYGLTREGLREAFAPYIARFGIELER